MIILKVYGLSGCQKGNIVVWAGMALGEKKKKDKKTHVHLEKEGYILDNLILKDCFHAESVCYTWHCSQTWFTMT